MENSIPEEPHKVFVTVQDTMLNGGLFKQELLEDDLPEEVHCF